MVDNLAMLISHGLIALMVWRLLGRADLDAEPGSDGGDVPQSAAERFARGG